MYINAASRRPAYVQYDNIRERDRDTDIFRVSELFRLLTLVAIDARGSFLRS